MLEGSGGYVWHTFLVGLAAVSAVVVRTPHAVATALFYLAACVVSCPAFVTAAYAKSRVDVAVDDVLDRPPSPGEKVEK